MADYNVKFTDTTKSPIVVPQDSELSSGTDLTLFGRSFLEYGEQLNENLLHMLENFAAPSVIYLGQPVPDLSYTTGGTLLSEPVTGQLWFNTTESTLFQFDGTRWNRMAAGSDYAGNRGQVSDGQSLPRPISSSGYVFPYSECIWLVSPAGHAGRFDYMACTTDNNAVVTMKYRLLGNSTMTSGNANYLIIGIRGNTNAGNWNETLPGITPTPTPTVGASATAAPSPTPVYTQTPVVSPTASVTPTPTPTRASSPTPTPVPSVTPSSRPPLVVQIVDSARGGNFASALSLCDIADHVITRDYGNAGCSTTIGICGVSQCAPEPGTYIGGGNAVGPEIGITVSGGLAPYTVRFKNFTMLSGAAEFAASGDCMFIGGSAGFSAFPSGTVYSVVIPANGGTVSGITLNASCGSGKYTSSGNFSVEVTDAVGTVVTRTFPYSIERYDSDELTNPSFEDGLANWTGGATINGPGGGGSSASWVWSQGPSQSQFDPNPQHLSRSARYYPHITSLGAGYLFSDSKQRVIEGQSKTASCYVGTWGNSTGSTGRISLRWLNSVGGVISIAHGTLVSRIGPYGPWRQSTVTASAPAGATHCQIVLSATITNGGTWAGMVAFDNVRIANT